MTMDRKTVRKVTIDDDIDDGYVYAEKDELISMIWEITKDTWAFVSEQNVEQRLQRNVANLVRREG
mgnify:CR=1 FL=1